MVHDIKNNEGGIMNKIKKLKVKAPPSVPQRDYAPERPADEEEQWSDDFDSDYENPDEHSDSEMYVLPAEEAGDDSYEPPPAEQETRTVHPALPFARGEYVGRKSGAWDSKSASLPAAPSPLPRAGQSLSIPQEENSYATEDKKPIPAERHRGSSHRQENMQSPVFPPPAQKAVHQKPIPLPRFPEGGSPTMDGPPPSFSSNSSLSEQDGSFLIRKSSGHDSKQPYTLVVFFNKRVYNIPVRFIEATKQYALGRKKTGEEYFGSVAEIIKNHQHSPLVLIDSQNNTKDSTRLKYAVKVP
ncbi:hypothetical protein MG293_019523 [Ovis ammon polii]|uniref:SH2 domain-containing protein n=1 Tax=Ovis ammon polii TaxID=230172 RepID=A0AAD4Y0K7_OVIAM|nr:hypothetical protein MG293_019523 [Ovis ammon polii]